MLLLLLWVWLLPGFSESYYQITETELNQIRLETSQLLLTVNELKESVRTLENQRNEYLTLSNELKAENQKLKKDSAKWKRITLSIGIGAIAGVAVLYAIK